MLSIAKDFNEREILTTSKYIGLKWGNGIGTGQSVRPFLTQRVYRCYCRRKNKGTGS
ncbi:hypothetical protein [Tuanshanicoccus lijuaniae]|uniref:hypothetical protein n=1 Tax=Aerococcaceae bacterium zg-1292 TaxID=2774330 RepID=UPI00385BB6A2